MFQNPDRWSFDCAEFRQVVHIYAMWKIHGNSYLDRFSEFKLRQHSSTGMNELPTGFQGPTMNWTRDSKDELFKLAVYCAPTKGTISESDLLSLLPVGAMVCFKNHEKASDTAYRNENALVDGPETFAAHPFGRGLAKKEIVDGLKVNNLKLLGNEYEDGIYVCQAQIPYSMPLSHSLIDRLVGSAEERAGSILKTLESIRKIG